jgi:microcystin-dependent protein
MESFLGQIQLFALGFVPRGWILCDGSSLPIAHYSAVFALLGTTYGGDGRTSFAVPNLKGKEPIPGLIYCLCLEGVFPMRE